MVRRWRSGSRPARAALGFLFLAAVAAALAATLLTGNPMSEHCEAAGGQLMVGPGGETACLSREGFLPLPGYDLSGASR